MSLGDGVTGDKGGEPTRVLLGAVTVEYQGIEPARRDSNQQNNRSSKGRSEE